MPLRSVKLSSCGVPVMVFMKVDKFTNVPGGYVLGGLYLMSFSNNLVEMAFGFPNRCFNSFFAFV